MPIPEWEGLYEVSDAGNVRSVTRTVTNSLGVTKVIKGKPRKVSMNNRNRAQVALWRDNCQTMAQVHHLVLEAFIGPRPAGLIYGCHRDDDPTNNRPSNLYWGTPSQNSADCIRNGSHSEARKTHCHAGHEFTDENTKISARKDGRLKRECRACLAEFNLRRRKPKAV